MPLSFSPVRGASLAGIVVLGTLALELGLRAAGFEYTKPSMRSVVWSKEEDVSLRSDSGLHEIDAHEIWRPRAGARIPWTADERVNARGYRGPELTLERVPDVVRIALLGGAATFGSGLEWKDTYAALLVDELATRGVRAEVLCAGVINSTLRQGLERYRALVRPHKPDIVLCAYWGHSSYQQAWHRFTDDSRIRFGCGMLLAPPEQGLMTNLRSELRLMHLVPWMLRVYDGTYWDDALVDMHERRLEKSIGLPNSPVVRRMPLADFRDSLVGLAHETRADGISLMFVNPPRDTGIVNTAPMLDLYHRVIDDVGREEQLAVLNDLHVAVQYPDGAEATEVMVPDRDHAGHSAQAVLARSLADILQGLPGMRR